ncbi:MAG: mannitol dehydrogenase family protein, partial [Pseudomonadota bacterium]
MPLPRLSTNLLPDIAPTVQRPQYDRTTVTPGIVHIGLGAFHRAHQAAYIDEVLAKDPSWGITGISLKRPDTRDALRPQDGLYTLASRQDDQASHRIIGSVTDILYAGDGLAPILDRLAHPATRIVSLTITEKGYCLDPASGRLDETHPDIAADLNNRDPRNPSAPKSVPGLILAALRKRREASTPPFTLLSCDNLRHNGRLLRTAITDLAALTDPDMVTWLQDTLACPSTMVDRIVPKTTQSDIDTIAQQCGYQDAWPVVAEPFGHWVIEDNFPLGCPPFDSDDISFVQDVGPHEDMKLRLLNGSHSALAYVGLLAGHKLVSEAMADPEIACYLNRLGQELLPTVEAPPDVDLTAYLKSVHERFGNMAIQHELRQIAADGSQKLPQRLLPAARFQAAREAPLEAIAKAVAAWIVCWQ